MKQNNIQAVALAVFAAAAAGSQTIQAQVPADPNAYYYLTNTYITDNRVLAAKRNAPNDYSIQVVNKAADPKNYWVVRPLGDDRYRIVNAYLGYTWSLDSSKTAPSVGPSGNYSGQAWTLTPWPGVQGGYRITNDFATGKSLDTYLSGASYVPAMNDTGSYSGQIWKLVKAANIPAPPTAATYYRLRNVATGQYLHRERGPLEQSRIEGGWWSAQWSFEKVAGFPENYYRIRNRWTDETINTEEGRLQVSASDPGWWSAQWIFEKLADGSYRIHSRWTETALAVQSNVPAIMRADAELTAARWKLEPFTDAVANPLIPATSFTASHSGKCLDVMEASSANGAPVVQNACDPGRVSQTWAERATSGPWSMVVFGHSGKCLEVRGANIEAGADLIQQTCDASRKQQLFRIFAYSADPLRFQIISQNSGLCVGINGADEDGAPASQQGCGALPHQMFSKDSRIGLPLSIVLATLESLDRQ